MARLLKKGEGSKVREAQILLLEKGYLTNEEIDGAFGNETYRAVRAFQSQNLDQQGQPLMIDGRVGALPSAIDYTQMPPNDRGGSSQGHAALAVAIGELRDGAGEVGGNNRGPFVKKYLNGLAPEGEPWCAGFISYCFSRNSAGMLFPYTVGARNILQMFNSRGWAYKPSSGYLPQPGHVVVWWRDQLSSGKGHIGLVHQLSEGFLYTIEGNKSPSVQGFNYVFSRINYWALARYWMRES